MQYNTLKFSAILERDIHRCILDNYNSEKTVSYMNNTSCCQSEEGKQAFRAGMVYAALLLSTECYQFGDLMVSLSESESYNNYQETQENIRKEVCDNQC